MATMSQLTRNYRFTTAEVSRNNNYTDTMWSLWKLYKPRRPGLEVHKFHRLQIVSV